MRTALQGEVRSEAGFGMRGPVWLELIQGLGGRVRGLISF